MRTLLWDELYENYYMDYGYFRVDYVYDDWEGYHIELYMDGNEVTSVFPCGDTWTLDDAVEHSKDLVKDVFEDAKRLLTILDDVDMEKVREQSQNTKVGEYDDWEEYEDWEEEYED